MTTKTAFALFVHDDRYNLPAIVQIAEHPFGHKGLDWRDVSKVPGVDVGWVAYPDGRVGIYVPPVDVARDFQHKVLRAECRTAIKSGFTSSALGSPHHYETSDSDRENLIADVHVANGDIPLGWRVPIKCTDGDGVVAMRDHDAAQVRQVFADFQALRVAAQAKHLKLREQVLKAPSVDIVHAIQW